MFTSNVQISPPSLVLNCKVAKFCIKECPKAVNLKRIPTHKECKCREFSLQTRLGGEICSFDVIMHKGHSSSVQVPPGLLPGHCLPCHPWGVGHLQILLCPGTGHLPTPGLFPSFWHARSFLSEYKYTENFTGKTGILGAAGIFDWCIRSPMLNVW